MTVTKGANGTIQVHDPKTGRIITNLPNSDAPAQMGVKKPLPGNAAATPPGNDMSTTVDKAYDKLSAHQNTHAKGEEAPDLSVQVDGGNTRLYVADPADKEWAAQNPEEALAAGKAFPSITTVQKMIPDISGALENYSKRMVARAAADEVRGVRDVWDAEGPGAARARLDDLLEKSEYSIPVLMVKTMGADKKDLAEASERGTKVHAIVERLGRGEPAGDVPAHLAGYVRAFQRFLARFPDLEIAYTEITVINEDAGYMGTADIVLKDRDGNYYAADYKTNKAGRIYDKVGTQLAAVANATHIVHPDGSREPLPPIAGGIGVGLSPNGECHVVAFPTKPYYEKFKLATQLWYMSRPGASKGTGQAVETQRDLKSMFS